MTFAVPASEQAAAKAAAGQNDATEWMGEVSGRNTVQYDEDWGEMTVIQEDGLHRRAQLKAKCRWKSGSQETYLAVAGSVYMLTGGNTTSLFMPSQAKGRIKAIQAARQEVATGNEPNDEQQELLTASSQVSDAVLKIGLEAAYSALKSAIRGDVVHSAPIKDDWEEFIAGPLKSVQPERAAEFNEIFAILKEARILGDSLARTRSGADSVHNRAEPEGSAPERQLSAWEEELALRRIARSYETYLITAAAVWVATGGELPPGQDEFLARMAAERLSALRTARVDPSFSSSSPSLSPPESLPSPPASRPPNRPLRRPRRTPTEAQLEPHEYTFFLSGRFGSRGDWEEFCWRPV
ncbi:hypothetical protein JCM10296v2_001669 [Rhodotorula toruloides]